jgi:hypothetical protein
VNAQTGVSEVIMTKRLTWALSALGLALIVYPPPATPATHAPTQAAQLQRALRAFDAAVREYVEVRRRQEPEPLDPMTADRERIRRWQDTFVAGIRDARVAANEGDIFNRDVAVFLRHRLAPAARQHRNDITVMQSLGEDSLPTVSINDPLPGGLTIRIPDYLLVYLPAVPDGLEYRLLGTDLLLWDMRVDLVVDILRDAIPAY